MNVALQEQFLQRNPFSNGECLISPGDETHRQRVLSFAEEMRLLAAIDAHPKRSHLKGILLIALDCGLRRGEIPTLKWSDVDFEHRTVSVRAFNAKTARSRKVGITSRLDAELLRLWQDSPKEINALVFGGLPASCSFLFNASFFA
jgi:integrase